MQKISVLICTYNRDKYLYKCLNSLVNQTLESDLYEVIIIDNNSTDNTKDICDEFISKNVNFIYFTEKKQGLSFARNRGVIEAKNDIIIFLDDDATAIDIYLEEIFNFFSKNKDVIAAGGMILPLYEGEEPKWNNKYIYSIFGHFTLGDNLILFPKKNYPRGVNMIMKKEAFDKYGLFNTSLGRIGKQMLGGEEKEFFIRLHNANEKIYYLPQALVYHIIPEFRTTIPFIKKQAIGIGASERIRIKGRVKLILQKIFSEMVKVSATFVLLFLYMFKGKCSKGFILVKFRFWIIQGLVLNP